MVEPYYLSSPDAPGEALVQHREVVDVPEEEGVGVVRRRATGVLQPGGYVFPRPFAAQRFQGVTQLGLGDVKPCVQGFTVLYPG